MDGRGDAAALAGAISVHGVNNVIATDVVEAVRAAANTGNGKIFVLDVEDAVRIRTNERGEAAV
jgi:nitrogen regulatory protein P-II 1